MYKRLKLQTKFQNHIASLLIFVEFFPSQLSFSLPHKSPSLIPIVPYLTKIYWAPQYIPDTKTGAKGIQR